MMNFTGTKPPNVHHQWQAHTTAASSVIITAVKQSVLEFLGDLENTLLVSEGTQDGCYVTTIICQQTYTYCCVLQITVVLLLS